MCLENVSKDFTAINLKKIGLDWYVYDFSVDYRAFDTSNIIDIHKYIMWKTWYEIKFGLIKKTFMGLLINIVNTSIHTKCISLSNQNCVIQPTFVNLYPNEYSQEFHYYPFTVKLDKYLGSCNTFNDLSNKACGPNKTRFKSKRVQHNYRNKWIENINKAYIMQM